MNKRKIKILLVLLLISLIVFSGCTNSITLFKNKENKMGETEQNQIQNGPSPEEKQRMEIEEQRKKELGDLYVPLPPLKKEENPRVKVKGIYITGNTAGIPQKLDHLVQLVENTELNAMVIDVKDDDGLMTYESKIEMVNKTGANTKVRIKNIDELISNLKSKNIYPIARIVVFKDPNLSKNRPDLSIQKKTGGVWRDNKGVSWVNPYNKTVWDYNIAIAKEAALHGFREIQFDYIRFPENGKKVDREAYFPGQNGKSKEDNIAEFIAYAREQLKDYNVYVSVDVFGLVTAVKDDMGIGQKWEKIAPLVDYISPMVYPSHYGPYNYGFKNPNAHPYEVVYKALKDAKEKNSKLQTYAIVRPWIQDFNLGYPPYHANELRAQIKAVYDNGYEEWMVWNPNNKYSENAFLKE